MGGGEGSWGKERSPSHELGRVMSHGSLPGGGLQRRVQSLPLGLADGWGGEAGIPWLLILGLTHLLWGEGMFLLQEG